MKKYKYMKIGIASPEEMITWANPELQGKNFVFNPNNKDKVVLLDDAGNELRDENGKVVEYVLHGEVKKSETINYRTQKPEKDGLFCEVIFGPVKDYCCACGKPARKSVGEHQKCEKCGVEFTESKVRRERMGYIALSAPVVHTWYLKNTPSKIAILLDMKTKEVESIVRQSSFIVTKVDESVDPDDLYVGQILTEQENAKFKRHYFGKFKSSTGAEIIKYLLKNIDLGKVMKEIRCELVSPSDTRKDFLEHRRSLLNQFYVDQQINWEKVDLSSFLSVSDIGCLLDIKPREYDGLMNKTSYLVVESTVREVENLSVISEQENNVKKKLYANNYKTITGVEALLYKLINLDFEEELKLVSLEIKSPTKQNKEKLVKRLEIVEAFYHSDNKPEWMVMDVVPVIPPDLRPMVQLEGGRFATTDLNELYRRILHRNTRLRKMYELGTPELITKNEKRLLQEAVDSLIDNSKRGGKAAEAKKGPLKSLSDILRGKQGRFRQNLLGKRVDYSGRSVICVGPFLKMYQCGIPYEMALTLFRPFVISYLRKSQNLDNQGADVDQNGLPISSTAKEKAGIKKAKELIEKGAPEAMDALEKIVVEHPVLLNRAPTLHRLSIQAFEPVLVQGKAIRLHPLATTAFNADFDGDQMPVHVPLSEEAQAEARMLMLASKNILAPKDGKPVVTPSQDMIIGNYYLTIERSQPDLQFSDFKDLYKAYENRIFEHDNKIIVNGDEENPYRDIEELNDEIKAGKTPSFGKFLVVGREGKAFKDISEIEHAYEEAEIDFHTRFVIPGRAIDKPFVNLDPSLPNLEERIALNEKLKDMYLVTTYGKIIFNQVFPESFVFFAEPDIKKDCLANLKDGTPERFFLPRGVNFKEKIAKMPLNQPVKKKTLSLIISEVFRQCKLAETSLTLDKMKDLGFYYSTISGITISAFDVETLVKKYEIIEEAEKNVNIYNRLYRRGTMLNAEREKKVISIWKQAKNDIKDEIDKVMKERATVNDIFMMADSGARGSADNFTQLAGMRGLMNKPNGEEMETPVKSNFAEGMSMADFFNSTHGARKGSTDTALKTAESGYLTRRLVDVSQDITITNFDCGTDKGIFMHTVYKPLQEGEKKSDDNILVALRDRILGRFAAKPVYAKIGGKKTKLCDRNDFIDIELADKIIASINWRDETEGVWVRTNLTCNSPVGVCVRCYGSDLSTNGIVEVGEVVGIVAAQSIGEPGTQLTMRTFHSGGVAGGSEDITQGLPRVQELFEARAPKGQAVISEIKGTVTAVELTSESRFTIHIVGDVPGNDKDYPLDYGKKPKVKVGDHVEPGDLLNDGAINVKDLLRVSSSNKVENYILEQIQLSYRTAAGVEISDKHVEIIVKQMLQKVVVIDAGETDLLPGSFVSKSELYNILKDCVEKGLRIPAVKPVILGITRASLKSDSFLAAASFQETTRVLTEAAIRGKVDKLEGLKENIIIGGLIPAGTGLVGDIDLKVENPTETYDIKKL